MNLDRGVINRFHSMLIRRTRTSSMDHHLMEQRVTSAGVRFELGVGLAAR